MDRNAHDNNNYYYAHTRAELRRYRWPRPRHAARLAALAHSWWRDNKNLVLGKCQL